MERMQGERSMIANMQPKVTVVQNVQQRPTIIPATALAGQWTRGPGTDYTIEAMGDNQFTWITNHTSCGCRDPNKTFSLDATTPNLWNCNGDHNMKLQALDDSRMSGVGIYASVFQSVTKVAPPRMATPTTTRPQVMQRDGGMGASAVDYARMA